MVWLRHYSQRAPKLEQFSAMDPMKIGSDDVASGDPILQECDLSAGLDHIPQARWVCGAPSAQLQFQSECMAESPADGDLNRRIVPGQLVVELSRLAHLEDLRLGRVKNDGDESYGGQTLINSEAGVGLKRVSTQLNELLKLDKSTRPELRGLKPFIDKEALNMARRQ